MPSLLTLPREIRDQILEDALSVVSRGPPADPSKSMDREHQDWDNEARYGRSIFVEKESQIRKIRNRTTAQSLRLTNRQLCTEAGELMAAKDYCLDVMHVHDCGLWPSWTSVSRLTHHPDRVHVQFRFFHPPQGVNPEWRFSSPSAGGSGSDVWSFYGLLIGFLTFGPSAFGGAAGRPSAFTIKELVLDAVPPPEASKQCSPVFHNYGTGDLLGGRTPEELVAIIREYTAKKGLQSEFPIPDARTTEELVAERLVYFISANIHNLLSMDAVVEVTYGAILYERIGTIDVRVGGKSRCFFDVNKLFGKVSYRHKTRWSNEENDRRRDKFDTWKSETSKLRRMHGLDGSKHGTTVVDMNVGAREASGDRERSVSVSHRESKALAAYLNIYSRLSVDARFYDRLESRDIRGLSLQQLPTMTRRSGSSSQSRISLWTRLSITSRETSKFLLLEYDIPREIVWCLVEV
jgi:hypothetical protein